MKTKETNASILFELPEAPEAFRALRWAAEISDRGLRRLSFEQAPAGWKTPPSGVSRNGATIDSGEELSGTQRKFFEKLKSKLVARLNGGRDDFKWDEFDLAGTGDFHQRVWQAMRNIPAGRTATYAETAANAGSPMAYRACGQACGANRILIFIPCHRVVASGGLGGFGYGLEWKKTLLKLEGAL